MSEVLQRLLEEGVADGTFPSVQAEVWLDGGKAFAGAAGSVGLETPFDLASLTKVLCTTALFVRLWAEGRLGPETPLARFRPQAAAAEATLGDLLAHRAGLPAFVPYFAPVMQAVPELRTPGCPPEVREAVAHEVRDAVLRTPPLEPPGTRVLYSDVGFLLLGELLAEVADEPLDRAYDHWVREPFSLGAHFHRLSTRGGEGDVCLGAWAGVPVTGTVRPRPPAPGQELRWKSLVELASAPGEVDDDNAWVMDGVAGHAGLFGTAADVARFGQAVLEELGGAERLAPASVWNRAVTPDRAGPGETWGLGFDIPARKGSSAGHLLGNLPPGAFGHLGFTGTSLWVDRARRLVVALVSNRTASGRGNLRIQAFRPRFHDAVVTALGVA